MLKPLSNPLLLEAMTLNVYGSKGRSLELSNHPLKRPFLCSSYDWLFESGLSYSYPKDCLYISPIQQWMDFSCSGINQPGYELDIPLCHQWSYSFFINTSLEVPAYTWGQLIVSMLWFINKHREISHDLWSDCMVTLALWLQLALYLNIVRVGYEEYIRYFHCSRIMFYLFYVPFGILSHALFVHPLESE